MRRTLRLLLPAVLLSLLPPLLAAHAQAPAAFDGTAHAAQVAAAVEEAPSVTDAPAEPPGLPAEIDAAVRLVGGVAGPIGIAIGVLLLLVAGLRRFGGMLYAPLGSGLAATIYAAASGVLLALGGALLAGQPFSLQLVIGAIVLAAVGSGLFSWAKETLKARQAGAAAAAAVKDRASALASIARGQG